MRLDDCPQIPSDNSEGIYAAGRTCHRGSYCQYFVTFLISKEFSNLQRKLNGDDKRHDCKKRLHPVISIRQGRSPGWTVRNLHTPALEIAGFLVFLEFKKSNKNVS
jgi:hypothetical protein